MKKLFNLIACALLIALAASCTSIKDTSPVMAIGGNNIVTNVKADIDYNNVKKIQGQAENHRILWIFSWTPKGQTQLKANNKYKGLGKTESVALYRAKNEAGSDIILEPEFETTTKTYFLGIYQKKSVKMTGWGAKIKGFSDATPAHNEQVSFSNSIF